MWNQPVNYGTDLLYQQNPASRSTGLAIVAEIKAMLSICFVGVLGEEVKLRKYGMVAPDTKKPLRKYGIAQNSCFLDARN